MGKEHNNQSQIKVAVIGAAAIIIAAFIGAIPVGSDNKPLACSFAFTKGIYNCNGDININEGNTGLIVTIIPALDGTAIVQTAIATFQTSQPTQIATSTSTPDMIVATLTAISQTQTAIATFQTSQPTQELTEVPTIIPTSNIVQRGITQAELNELISNCDDSDNLEAATQALIDCLDIYWGQDPRKGGEWGLAEAETQITGPAVFWTNLFENANSLPSNVEPVRMFNRWGIFRVNGDSTYIINEPTEGGRYLYLVNQ